VGWIGASLAQGRNVSIVCQEGGFFYALVR